MKITVDPDLLLCISPDNRMLHVGPAKEVLAHVAVSAAAAAKSRSPQKPIPLEVYDINGRRIPPKQLQQLSAAGSGTAMSPETSRLLAPVPRRGPVSTRTLLRRIDAALDFAQSYLTAHPDAGHQGPGIPAATQVPRPEGSYAEVLQALADQLAPLDPKVQSNRGNWFHNLWHAATGTS